jgi:hypothetical protein
MDRLDDFPSPQPAEIPIDEQADDILKRIAESNNDQIDPDLLRAVIPDKAAFLDYITQRGLVNSPAARCIMAQLDALDETSTERDPSLESAADMATVALVVAIRCDLPEETVLRVLEELRKMAVHPTREKITVRVPPFLHSVLHYHELILPAFSDNEASTGDH